MWMADDGITRAKSDSGSGFSSCYIPTIFMPKLMKVKVQANSREAGLTVRAADSFLIRVREPAEQGRANAAALALLAAHALQDLRVPPANRLEALKGDRKGFFSIRINDQFRVVFRWVAGDAYDVQIVDYH